MIMRKVGIMGGTFDPIHIGHLILGEAAYEQYSLEKVLFMPAGRPPFKEGRKGMASNEQRTEMVRRAIASNPHFELSMLEMNEDGMSYTYRTLEKLKEEHPDTVYYFVMGADSLMYFDTWMNPQRIADAAIIVVATRNHMPQESLDEKIRQLTEKFHASIRKLETPNLDISSSQIREWVSQGRGIQYYVPDPEIHYIEEQGLYQDI
ncbi:MAG: nicotinate-nucleotide adenylyltransferase [Lachnospiraceae bacterium]|nr:nicotinate-nucleotide adenylyltransferase [Lachnospiraceae bacterium]